MSETLAIGPAAQSAPLEWRRDVGPVDYEAAVLAMEQRVADIASGVAPEMIWLLEHPPLYTAGTSARDADLIDPDRFPVHRTGRGGQFTYHGPGQRVAYVLLNLKRRGGDLHAFVRGLENWLIAVLAEHGVKGEIRSGRVGVWVNRKQRDNKIAAIGVRVRRGVSYHGVSLNVSPDLSHFEGIVPCGIREHGVTSLAALGVSTAMESIDAALMRHFECEVLKRLA